MFGEGGQAYGLGRVVGPGPGHDGDTAFDLLDADAHGFFVFLVGHSGGFARGAAGEQTVDPLLYLPFNEGAIGFFVNSAVFERRHKRGDGSSKHETP